MQCGSLFLIQGATVGFVGNLGIHGQSPRGSHKAVCSETSVSEKGACEWRNSLKLSESLYPAEKRSKKEPSATAFSGCGGDGSSNESLEEEDAIQVELQGSELWKRFHDIGTEMIITKAGRFASA